MQIEEVVTAPRSPWQNAYVERFIGSIRRECLDHVIVLSAVGLQRVVKKYVAYYMRSRTHLSLEKDSPTPRPVMPATRGASSRSQRSTGCTIDTTGRPHSPTTAPSSLTCSAKSTLTLCDLGASGDSREGRGRSGVAGLQSGLAVSPDFVVRTSGSRSR